MASTQPTLSPTQLSTYLSYINLPAGYRSGANPPLTVDFLSVLHKCHITTIPYENLSLHYAADTRLVLDIQTLYTKFLSGRGRGGYCMEGTIFFNHVLRGLGFSAYLTGARIRFREGGVPRGDYSGWVHVINIVNLPDGTRWAIDSAFGGDGMTSPLPLSVEQDPPSFRNLGTQEVRLTRGPIPNLLSPLQEQFWIYQYRNKPEDEWNSFFAFGETEFLQKDFEVMSWYTSAHPESFQTFTVLVVKFLRGKGSDGPDVIGKVMLVNGEVKRNLGGKTETVKVCSTEEERIKALRVWFGIELTEAEREGIRGRSTELTG